MPRSAHSFTTSLSNRVTAVAIVLTTALTAASCGGERLRECKPVKAESFGCSGGVITTIALAPKSLNPKTTDDFGCRLVVDDAGVISAVDVGALCADTDPFRDSVDPDDMGRLFTRVCLPPQTDGVWVLPGAGSDVSLLVSDGGATCW